MLKLNAKKTINLSLTLLAVAVSSVASAQAQVNPDDISLGIPAYGGTGCPAGSASATISPDGKQLSLLFDQFLTEAGGITGRTLDRKSCNVAIPVHVPAGFSVSIIAVDYRGFNSLPFGARSTFNVEYFFAGSVGPRFSKSFSGPIAQDFLIQNRLIATGLSWSACGEDVILRTNANIMTTTNAQRQQAMSIVDSVDINAGIVYQLQWRRCI